MPKNYVNPTTGKAPHRCIRVRDVVWLPAVDACHKAGFDSVSSYLRGCLLLLAAIPQHWQAATTRADAEGLGIWNKIAELVTDYAQNPKDNP